MGLLIRSLLSIFKIPRQMEHVETLDGSIRPWRRVQRPYWIIWETVGYKG